MPLRSPASARLAVDIGGTFTDLALEHDGKRTTTKILFESLEQSARDALIKEALESLVKRPVGTYGERAASPLQQAFNTAVRLVAIEIVNQVVTESAEFHTKVRQLVESAVADAMNDDTEVKRAIANAVADALSKRVR